MTTPMESSWSVPHTRGDGPLFPASTWSTCARVPHTRGDGPRGGNVDGLPILVFPTRVGMDRIEDEAMQENVGVPHTRGDGPNLRNEGIDESCVFPTRVGMDRRELQSCCRSSRVPHTRGDGPATIPTIGFARIVFPTRVGMDRADRAPQAHLAIVFPTRVGMDRQPVSRWRSRPRCSPHAWGWTDGAIGQALLYKSVPHTRGDGPEHTE